MIRAHTRTLGGSPLARKAIDGELPQWYPPLLHSPTEWAEAARTVASEFAGRDWLGALAPALALDGAAAKRLSEAARSGGIVVTGGQQPGLFGGPLYVLHKALSILELADSIERETGVPTAPVFWAATDDTDFVEADHVGVLLRGAFRLLRAPLASPPGLSMAATELGDVGAQLAVLREACGFVSDSRPLTAVGAAYGSSTTVGSSYVGLLREILHPLGIAVLDASHSAVKQAAAATLRSALTHAAEIRDALTGRVGAIRDAGLRPQVADVPNLSLVFVTERDGSRRRVPVNDAAALASHDADDLGANVLLRPIIERQILPTVTYVGGPGEIAYFAQVSAVAEALRCAAPRIVPRWSGTLIENHVAEILGRLNAGVEDFADPHRIEGRVARSAISLEVRTSLDALRTGLEHAVARLAGDPQTSPALERSVGSMRAGVEHRLERLERRYAAAVKQAGSDSLRAVAVARAALFPNGAPQERVLSFIPFVARYGDTVIDAIRTRAREHVASLIARG